MERTQLLATIEASWQALDAAIDGLDDRALTQPGAVGEWSVAEVLGHVTAWDQMALRHVEQWRRGEPLDVVGGPAVDSYNAEQAASRAGWPIDRLRAEHSATRERLRAAIAACSDAEWATVRDMSGEATSLGELVASDLGGSGPGDHAAEHAEQIQSWRAAGQPGAAGE